MKQSRKQIEEALERAHMDVVHYMAESVARHEQVKALRKIAKELYRSLDNADWTTKMAQAVRHYDELMK